MEHELKTPPFWHFASMERDLLKRTQLSDCPLQSPDIRFSPINNPSAFSDITDKPTLILTSTGHDGWAGLDSTLQHMQTGLTAC